VYRGLRVLGIVPVLDEEEKIGLVVARVPRDVVDEVLVVDDGSTDDSTAVARREGAEVLELGATLGVGAAIREGFRYAQAAGFDVVVVMAGTTRTLRRRYPSCWTRSSTAPPISCKVPVG